jgi:hypothetical protein
MKTYPKIEYLTDKFIGKKFWAFDKLDGSNLRFEWNKKRGWYKFGTRKTMISEIDPNFGSAIPLFLEKYGDDLESIFRKKYPTAQSVIVFGEYLGDNSFAGQHLQTDKKDIILFDVNLYKKGFINPQEFIDNFGHLDIPKLVYNDIFDLEFVESIKINNYNLKEGVICKGINKTKGEDLIWMTKIKTNQWLESVKKLYGEKVYLEEFN